MGFAVSFDGWNGQTFKESQRPLTESDVFNLKEEEAVVIYLLGVLSNESKSVDFVLGPAYNNAGGEHSGDRTKPDFTGLAESLSAAGDENS